MRTSRLQHFPSASKPFCGKFACFLPAFMAFTIGAHAVPITYTLVVQKTPTQIEGDIFNLGVSGQLVSKTGTLNFGGSNGDVVLTLIFEGDTSDAVSYSVPCNNPNATCPVNGSEIIPGTAAFQIRAVSTGHIVAQGTFLPSAKIFVGVDTTNGGISFGSFAVADPTSTAFPGEALYPYGLDAPSTVVKKYDLKSDLTFGMWESDFSRGTGDGRVPGHSCVGFPVVLNPCNASKPLATTAGTLYFDSTPISASDIDPAGSFMARTHPYPLLSFTGNAKGDVVWRHAAQGTNMLWALNGSTLATTSLARVADPYWQVAAIADFNGNGRADLLWRDVGDSSAGAISVWTNRGNGTSFTPTSLPSVSLDWQIAGTGDFNGDHKTDILWRDRVTGANHVWLMNGTTYTLANLPTESNLHWEVEGVADFNGDGKADILWYNAATRQVRLWLMNGAILTKSINLATVSDPKWKIVAVGDFQGDKHAGIVWRHQGTGEVDLWTLDLQANAVASRVRLGIVSDLLWQIDGVGDLNGDGKADLLWRHDLAGINSVWYMEGPHIQSTSSLKPMGDLDWQVY